MELRFDPSGMVTIVAGTHSHGQGHATTYAQLVSDWLGVPFENVRLVQGDTDAVAFGRGTYASRSAMLGGSALKGAADAIIEKAKAMAAHLLEAAGTDLEFKEGRFLHDVLRTLRVVNAGKLDDDSVIARFLNERLGHTKLVDTIANDFEGVVDRLALVGDRTLRLIDREREVHPALKVETELQRNTPNRVVDELIVPLDALDGGAREKRPERGGNQTEDDGDTPLQTHAAI